MPYVVNLSEECEAWLASLDRELEKTIAAHIGLLVEYGPHLARPYADTLTGSHMRNLKELRV